MRSLFFASTLLLSVNSYAFDDFEKALTSYNTNYIDEAYIHLRNVLKNDEDNLPAIILMGRVLLKKGLYLEGIEVFQEALYRGADVNFFLNDLTSALMLTSQFDEVIKLSKNKNLSPESKLTTLLLSGNAYSAISDNDNAGIAYQQAYALSPNNIRTIGALASFQLTQNNITDAENLIVKGLMLFPNDSRVWNLKGQLHESKSEPALALKAYEEGYDVNPKDPFIQRSLANAYASAKRSEEALVLIDNILEETPSDPFAKLLKSRLFSYVSRENEANQILEDISQKLSLLSDEQRSSNASLSLVSATAAYLQNNLEHAQKELQFYLKKQPQDLSAISLLVDIYLGQGQEDKAFELLESKRKIIQYDLKLSLKLFELYLNENKVYKAVQTLEPLEKTYGKHLKLILAKANLLSKSGQTDKALILLEENKPEKFSSAYYLTKGLLLSNDNQTDEANKIADELLKLNKNNTDYLSFKANILLRQSNWNEALSILSKIIELQPDNFSALFNSATANAALSNFDEANNITIYLLGIQPENTAIQILKAKIDRNMGDMDAAKSRLNKILAENPTYTPALEVLMKINYQQKLYNEAFIQADKLSKISFLNTEYIKMKAQIYIGLNDFKNAQKQLQILFGVVTTPREIFLVSQMQLKANDVAGAKRSLEKALSIEPDNSFIQRSLVKMEIDSGELDNAREILNNLEKSNKNNPNVLMLKGDISLKENDKVKAQKYYLQALNADNNFHIVLLKSYKLALDNIDESNFTSTLVKILKKNPDNHLMRSIYADFLLHKGQSQEAKNQYERLLTVENLKNKASILNNLANIYLSSDLNKAEEYSRKSMELNSNSSAIMDTYGWILSLNNQYDKSLPILRNANSMDSNNPAINYHIGYVLVKLDRIEEAKRELRQAVFHKKEFSERDKAKQLLDSL